MTPTERALVAEYEAVLAREGLSVLDDRELLHPKYVGGGSQLNRGGATYDKRGTAVAVLARVRAKEQFWSLVSKGIGELPRNYPHRGFLVNLAETGNLLGACRTYAMTHDKGRWAFRTFLRSIGLGASRPARI